MDFDALRQVRLGPLEDAVADWKLMADRLRELERAARDGLQRRADRADWSGLNSQVSRRFIGRTAGEFADARAQAGSIHAILRDTLGETRAQHRRLTAAVESAEARGMRVHGSGSGFTVRAADTGSGGGPGGGSGPTEGDLRAVRDEIETILARAVEIDTSAAEVLVALMEQAEYGFSGAEYAGRGAAAGALATAERLAVLARKDPGDLTVKEFDALTAGLKKYAGDELFAARFAGNLGGQGTLDFWVGVNDPRQAGDLARERHDKFDDLQKQLSLTLATASHSSTWEMDRWRNDVLGAADKQISGSTALGVQVMSNLMRSGNFNDRFLLDYGARLMETEREFTDNGRGGAWKPLPLDPDLNHTGTDAGSDPAVGFLMALSQSPEASTAFFGETFVGRHDDHEFYEDKDEDGNRERRELSNFDYFFEERDWPRYVDSKGKDSDVGVESLGSALESATTGHPSGTAPRPGDLAHSPEQAALFTDIVVSVAEKPERVGERDELGGSLGRLTAEYMMDINRSFGATDDRRDYYFPAPGAVADPTAAQTTRFLHELGKNSDGYAALNIGQNNYSAQLIDYHVRSAEGGPSGAVINDAIKATARIGGEIQGIISDGRAIAVEEDRGEADAKFNKSLEDAKTWGSALVGGGVGILLGPTSPPAAIVGGELAKTAAGEIIGWITDGYKKDSTDEVIYRNGQEWDSTRESTFQVFEKAYAEAWKNSGRRDDINVDVAGEAKQGFTNAAEYIRTSVHGAGAPGQLETKG
ncbi:hypothetical protein ABT354_15315 [Streptomyces sp. NPDC000594]|uniref:hypothetical protein n=1 Tax=Streptomyces sp. NPDC000594 TaxID=3154261 RepID=UPI0033197A8A